MKTLLFFFLLLLVVPLFSFSAEVDNFTDRDKPLIDATQIINHAVNFYLDQAITAANKKGSCDKGRLYNAIRVRFRDQYQDKFADYVHNSNLVPKREIATNDSIYDKFSTIDSLVIGGLGLIYDSNAPVVRMNDVQIGGDKFEHFFGMGYFYFRRYYLKEQKIAEVLAFGMGTETGILGSYMTGVISFADLAANFKGMLFWNHLLQEGQDLLKFERPIGPYVQCQQGKWKRIQDVDLSIYIDNAWDEAINCSLFSRQKLLDKIEASMQRLSVTCPITSEQLQKLDQIYGDFAPYMVNKKGHGILKRP